MDLRNEIFILNLSEDVPMAKSPHSGDRATKADVGNLFISN